MCSDAPVMLDYCFSLFHNGQKLPYSNTTQHSVKHGSFVLEKHLSHVFLLTSSCRMVYLELSINRACSWLRFCHLNNFYPTKIDLARSTSKTQYSDWQFSRLHACPHCGLAKNVGKTTGTKIISTSNSINICWREPHEVVNPIVRSSSINWQFAIYLKIST